MMMNVVDRGELQAMWEELAGKVGHCDHSLSANHAYLKTLYSTFMIHVSSGRRGGLQFYHSLRFSTVQSSYSLQR